jgi:hypothetical protein
MTEQEQTQELWNLAAGAHHHMLAYHMLYDLTTLVRSCLIRGVLTRAEAAQVTKEARAFFARLGNDPTSAEIAEVVTMEVIAKNSQLRECCLGITE